MELSSKGYLANYQYLQHRGRVKKPKVMAILDFFPRVRTPCGRSAQVIKEGKETQRDEGDRNTSKPKRQTNTNQTKTPNTKTRGRIPLI